MSSGLVRKGKGEQMARVYVASSWKNLLYPGIVHALTLMGHTVYDFRNPKPETPDLMFREATICGTMDEFFDALNFHD